MELNMGIQVLSAVCGVALAGSVYMAGWGSSPCCNMAGMASDECPACAAQVVLMDAAATAPAAGVDVKNTKCLVTGEDVGKSTETIAYDGKLYHICCHDCVADFQKDPTKYVKAIEADPAKFGVKK